VEAGALAGVAEGAHPCALFEWFLQKTLLAMPLNALVPQELHPVLDAILGSEHFMVVVWLLSGLFVFLTTINCGEDEDADTGSWDSAITRSGERHTAGGKAGKRNKKR